MTSFPVLHVGPVPSFDPQTWRFRVFGLVHEENTYTYAEFTSGTVLPMSTVQADFHCVTSWSKLDNVWEGVRFTDLWAQVQVRSAATHVMAHCPYGYTTNIPLAPEGATRVEAAIGSCDQWTHGAALVEVLRQHSRPDLPA